ncbi:hypothetical protein ACTXG6_43525 [Pseudonocardia sp. Cha107L01]|uniref:hypothetical protein n=1 Tax=Pseudonocardia sp. Cha107L01 TaxID=3457576 RepID=UPI00403EF005
MTTNTHATADTYSDTVDATMAAGPQVVTLCGSMRFFDLILAVAAEETAAGAVVLAPFTVIAPAEQGGTVKAQLDRLHRYKIDLSDRVVVVTDASGYWGVSTSGEIAHARRAGIPVTIRRVELSERGRR